MLAAGPTVTAVAVQEALVNEAATRVAKAQATVAECVLVSPFAGIVARVYVRPGDLATAKAPLLDLIEKDTLVVRFSIPEAQSAAVVKDMPVSITLDALPKRKFETRVTLVYPEIDPGTRTRLVEAAVAPGLGAAPGMFARVAVAVRTLPDAVVVPESALVTLPNGETVAFVLEGDKAVRRRIKVALEAGGAVGIESGIKAGEMVIIQGNEALKDGAPAQVKGGKQEAGGGPGAAQPAAPGKDKPAL